MARMVGKVVFFAVLMLCGCCAYVVRLLLVFFFSERTFRLFLRAPTLIILRRLRVVLEAGSRGRRRVEEHSTQTVCNAVLAGSAGQVQCTLASSIYLINVGIRVNEAESHFLRTLPAGKGEGTVGLLVFGDCIDIYPLLG